MIHNIKHLISIRDYNIEKLLSGAKSFDPDLLISPIRRNEGEGKIMANLFYEPSTRTSSSFASAMFKLGGNVISINDVNYSSVAKGENLRDTIKTMATYADIIVLRTKVVNEAKKAAEASNVPIINAGDGNGEHPTQTLADLYTIQKKFGSLDDLTVSFIGDISNSRTIHSLDDALPEGTVKHYIDTYDINKPWPKSDVYYLTRIQKERGSIGNYKLTKQHVDNMPKESIVLHPFPRNEEIPRWFDSDPRGKYFEQMKNGLYVRMAILVESLKS